MIHVGDKCRWQTQGKGSYATHEGEVVAVVPARQQVSKVAEGIQGKRMFNGRKRGHLSFLVKVGNLVYWPRVSQLRKV